MSCLYFLVKKWETLLQFIFLQQTMFFADNAVETTFRINPFNVPGGVAFYEKGSFIRALSVV